MSEQFYQNSFFFENLAATQFHFVYQQNTENRHILLIFDNFIQTFGGTKKRVYQVKELGYSFAPARSHTSQ